MIGKRPCFDRLLTLPETACPAKIMVRHMSSMRTALLALPLAAFVLLCGCGPGSYKVLSFFFDGVPDPAKAVIKGAPRVAADDKAAKAVSKGSEHGPYAAKNCEACHNRQEGNTLVLPIDKLCVKCHLFNFEALKWVHGPVASAGCRACHAPHRSGFPFLLDAPVEKICYRCHDEKSVLKNVAHQDLTSGCAECHNPHASQQKFLLR